MKNLWKISSIVLFLFSAALFVHGKYYHAAFLIASGNKKAQSDYINTAYWKDRDNLFDSLTCKDKIVFIGNSITDFCEWGEVLKRNDIVNRGISADITYGVLVRIEKYLKQEPKALFISIGINDIGKGIFIDSIKRNYIHILDMKNKYRALFIVQSVLYISKGGTYDADIVNPIVADVNSFLKRECGKRDIPFVDLNPAISNKGYLLPIYTTDGLHLNGAAYIKWANEISPYIEMIN